MSLLFCSNMHSHDLFLYRARLIATKLAVAKGGWHMIQPLCGGHKAYQLIRTEASNSVQDGKHVLADFTTDWYITTFVYSTMSIDTMARLIHSHYTSLARRGVVYGIYCEYSVENDRNIGVALNIQFDVEVKWCTHVNKISHHRFRL